MKLLNIYNINPRSCKNFSDFLLSSVLCLLYIYVNRFLQNELTTQFERVKCVKI